MAAISHAKTTKSNHQKWWSDGYEKGHSQMVTAAANMGLHVNRTAHFSTLHNIM